MKVFVTGGTGFVGTHLVRALRERGDRVTCLVRSPARAQGLGWTDVRVLPGDLDSPAALREGCAGADVVYHVAGRISARNLREFRNVNRDGTARVLEAARAAPPGRFVHVSTLAVGGPTVPGRPIDEERPPQPVTSYGQSKLEAEALVRASGIPWTIVRPPVVYGERDRETLRIFRLARAGWGPVMGDGTQELSVIYAGDLAAALIAAGTATATLDRVYYAAHPEVTTSMGLVRAVGVAVGRTPRIVRLPAALARVALWTVGSLASLAGRATVLSAEKADEFLAPAWTCRPDALARDSGWRAATDLAAGLSRTAAWYRAEGWL
ncbi:MAG TPA: NAD-dependent epimerase/dehydratase family protein [Gemmatimonadales bacterium]